MTMAGRDILGPADVDDETFTGIVARALAEDPADVTVLSSQASVVPYSLDAITTAGRYWVSAQAATPAGDRTVRMFVKHVQSWARSPLFRFVPEEVRGFAATSVPWRTEPLVYQSDLRDRLPPGLTMPLAHHVAMLDDSSAAIWLPALDVVDHDWQTADYAHAAHLLGRLAASADRGRAHRARGRRRRAAHRAHLRERPARHPGGPGPALGRAVAGPVGGRGLRAGAARTPARRPRAGPRLGRRARSRSRGQRPRRRLPEQPPAHRGVERHHPHRLRLLEPSGGRLRPRPAARR